MRKFLFLPPIVIFLILTFTTPVSAKKLLPRARPSVTSRLAGGSGGVGISVKFRPNRLAIVVTFTNLSAASSVSYTLSYNTRGTTQGAGGTINTANSEASTIREFLFGTCSHGVCRYDSGITNAKFVTTTTLTNGKKVIKNFRLKV